MSGQSQKDLPLSHAHRRRRLPCTQQTHSCTAQPSPVQRGVLAGGAHEQHEGALPQPCIGRGMHQVVQLHCSLRAQGDACRVCGDTPFACGPLCVCVVCVPGGGVEKYVPYSMHFVGCSTPFSEGLCYQKHAQCTETFKKGMLRNQRRGLQSNLCGPDCFQGLACPRGPSLTSG